MTKPKLSPEATKELQAVLDRAARRLLREEMAAAADEDANLDPDERCLSKSVGPNGAQYQCVLTARHEDDHRAYSGEEWDGAPPPKRIDWTDAQAVQPDA
jgi:hypothetical protein